MNINNLESCGPKGQLLANTSLGVEGFVECSVVDSKTGEVIRSYPRQHNLILNYGLNYWCNSATMANCWITAVVGTGTTVTSVDSSPTTAAQSGTTVNLSGGSFLFTNTSTDAGRMIKWDTGEEAMVITVSSTTQATVTPSQSVSDGAFNYYHTNQTALATEIKRSYTYLTTAGACGWTGPSTTGATATYTLWRTYDFTAETGARSYTEIGFSPIGTAGANLWARILLSSPIALEALQQLRVKYTVYYSISPVTSIAVTSSVITGWTGAVGNYMVIKPDISGVDTNGGTNSIGLSSQLEPAAAGMCMISTWIPTWPPTFNTQYPVGGTYGVITYASQSLLTYNTNNFYRNKTCTIPVATGNSTSIRSIFISSWQYGSDSGTQTGWIFLMDSAQTKDNTHTLTLIFRMAVGRVLA